MKKIVGAPGGGVNDFRRRLQLLSSQQEALLSRENEPVEPSNGVITKYRHPVLTAAHTPLTATGIYIILQDFSAVLICVTLVVVTMGILKVNWYDRMEDYPADLVEVDSPVAEVTGN